MLSCSAGISNPGKPLHLYCRQKHDLSHLFSAALRILVNLLHVCLAAAYSKIRLC